MLIHHSKKETSEGDDATRKYISCLNIWQIISEFKSINKNNNGFL